MKFNFIIFFLFIYNLRKKTQNMKTIKNYEKFVNENYKIDESWRQVKMWLQLPKILFEELLNKIISFVPKLSFKYDKLSAKIDTGSSLSKYKIDTEPQKLTLNDIKNKSIRNTLKTTGLFNSWNVYYMRTNDNRQFNDDSRDVIYISKDELKKGDDYYGERISDSDFNKEYKKTNGSIKKMKRNNPDIEKFADIEPQIYIVAAVHTDEHDEMKKERDDRYTKSKSKELEKLVKKCIKDENLIGRTKSIKGNWSRKPVLAKVVEADRLDLAKDLVNACYDAQEVIDMIEEDYEIYDDRYINIFKEKNISVEMKDFLKDALELAHTQVLEADPKNTIDKYE